MTKSFIGPILSLTVAVAVTGCAPKPDEPNYEALYRPILDTYTAVWNGASLGELNQIVGQNYKQYGTGGTTAIGLDGLKKLIGDDRIAYPDVKLTPGETYYIRDHAFRRWTSSATNTGPGATPASGKSFRNDGLTEFTFQGGKIVDEAVYYSTREATPDETMAERGKH